MIRNFCMLLLRDGSRLIIFFQGLCLIRIFSRLCLHILISIEKDIFFRMISMHFLLRLIGNQNTTGNSWISSNSSSNQPKKLLDIWLRARTRLFLMKDSRVWFTNSLEIGSIRKTWRSCGRILQTITRH